MIRHQRDSEPYLSLPASLCYLHRLYSLALSASLPTANDKTNLSPLPPETAGAPLTVFRGERACMLVFFLLPTLQGDEKDRQAVFGVSVRLAKRVHIQFPHLYFGSRQEQGDISAVLPGENSHRLLPVLDVHSIYLGRGREARARLSDNPKKRGLAHQGWAPLNYPTGETVSL